MNTRRIVGVLAIVTLLPATAAAHHGWSSYDSSKPLSVTGVIKELTWIIREARAGGCRGARTRFPRTRIGQGVSMEPSRPRRGRPPSTWSPHPDTRPPAPHE
jgi:hypothetical protein